MSRLLQGKIVMSIVKSIYNYIEYCGLLLRGRIKVKKRFIKNKYGYECPPNPYKIIYIDPNDINLYHDTKSWDGKFDSYGRIESGDWDIANTKPILEKEKIRAVVQHFNDDIPWEDTGIIETNLKYIEHNGSYHGCESKEDLLNHYNRIDNLYQDILNNGYRTPTRASIWDPRKYKAISISIGRNGNFIFERPGNHRLGIAIALNLDKIPARVCVRHEEWQQLRCDVAKHGREVLNNNPDVDPNHPDLRNI